MLLERGVKQRHSGLLPRPDGIGSAAAHVVTARRIARFSVCLRDMEQPRAEMERTPQVELILDVLRTTAPGGLKDEQHFALFLLHAQRAGKQAELGRLAFQGKYLRNVYAAIRRQSAETEGHDSMEKEFSRAVNDFHGLVSDFIADAEQDFRVPTERDTLAVTEDGLRALLRLADDFAALKNLELEMMQAQGSARGAPEEAADGNTDEGGE